MPNFFLSLIVFIGLLSLSGCASVVEIENGTFETRRIIWDESREGINYQRKINHKNANEKCSSMGKLVDHLGEWNLSNDELVQRFKCIDPSVKRQRDLEAVEANKKEQERRKKLAEEERKRNEEERKRYEAEQKAKEAEHLRIETLKAAEWERTRPQREAEQRRALAAEESRLNSICPKYYIVRQSCAGAVFSTDCMRLRYGKDFSKKDHDTCFYR